MLVQRGETPDDVIAELMGDSDLVCTVCVSVALSDVIVVFRLRCKGGYKAACIH